VRLDRYRGAWWLGQHCSKFSARSLLALDAESGVGPVERTLRLLTSTSTERCHDLGISKSMALTGVWTIDRNGSPCSV